MLKLKLLILRLLFGMKKKNLLVILQNNNELRATGGFITKAINVELGRLQIKMKFLDVFTDLAKNVRDDAPKPIRNMLNDKFYQGWVFRDANFNPDFSKSAAKLIEFYGKDVEALLAVNYSFIENVLSVIGDVKIGDEIVNKGNLFMFLSSNTADIDRHDLESIRARKNIIPQLYKKIFNKIVFAPHKWFGISQVIKNSWKNKDLQIWEKGKNNPTGFDTQKAADFIAINESNFLGGKSNRYIKRTVFRNIGISKDGANVELTVFWEHQGKYNYPLSSKYNSYIRIYLPKDAEINTDANILKKDKHQIVEFEMSIMPGEKGAFNLSYKIPKDFINERAYSFTYIKQSGVQDEFLTESYSLPLHYSFTDSKLKNTIIHENTCSIKNSIENDLHYILPVYKANYRPRLILHDFSAPNKIKIRFNEPVKFKKGDAKDNIEIRNKKTNDVYKISESHFHNNNTVLELEVDGIPEKEEEFYVLDLFDIENNEGVALKDNPRKATVVYRSGYFK